jgi:TonB family protein
METGWRSLSAIELSALLCVVVLSACASSGQLREVRLASACPVSQPECRPEKLRLDTASLASRYFPPPNLRAIGVGGRATLEFTVLGDGRVDPNSIKVQNSTAPTLGESAALAVRGWSFVVASPTKARLPSRMVVALALEFDGTPCRQQPRFAWHWLPELVPQQLLVRACTQDLIPSH